MCSCPSEFLGTYCELKRNDLSPHAPSVISFFTISSKEGAATATATSASLVLDLK
jgi:hypothetical protein